MFIARFDVTKFLIFFGFWEELNKPELSSVEIHFRRVYCAHGHAVTQFLLVTAVVILLWGKLKNRLCAVVLLLLSGLV